MKPQNTRFAPSPTGYPHLGLLRTAYHNWLAARSTGGSFVLRIDDTDTKRSDPKYVDTIYRMMDKFGLDYDKVVTQSSRFYIYRSFAQYLINNGFAYKNKDGTVRISDTISKVDYWKDNIAGDIKISDDDLNVAKNRVIIKSNGSPAYNFASVVDDFSFNVNCVIRGKDHITNTSFQVILFHLFKFNVPDFYHVGLITKNKKKMSKRDADMDLLSLMYIYDLDAILNCVIRLGWSPTKDDKTTKILTKDTMLKMFWSNGKLRGKNSEFDIDKLKAWDRKYRARK